MDQAGLLADSCREIERFVASNAFTPAVALLLDVCNTIRPDARSRAISLSRRYYDLRRPGQKSAGETIDRIEGDLLAMVAELKGEVLHPAARPLSSQPPPPQPAQPQPPPPQRPAAPTPTPATAPSPPAAPPPAPSPSAAHPAAPRPAQRPLQPPPIEGATPLPGPRPVPVPPPTQAARKMPAAKAKTATPATATRTVADKKPARASVWGAQPDRLVSDAPGATAVEAPAARATAPGVAVGVVGVTKTYQRSEFHLNDFSVELRDGAITALVGRNGSGKTTLLRIVIGELAPDSGRIDFGFAGPGPTDWSRIKPQIGYVAQRAEFWRGTLKTHLLYVSAMNSEARRADEEDVEWHLHRYGLFDYREATWSELSGGYRTRAQLVRALLAKPKLLVLDEPLAYLDIAAQDVFLSDLRVIASGIGKRIPILITSQHIAEIEGIADRIVVLDRGVCRFSGSIDQLFAEAEAYYYEVSPRIDPGEAIRLLADLGIDEVRPLSNGNLLVFRRVKEPHEVFAGIVTAFKGRLRSIRDITASTERMLRDT
ncbi:MAG: ABC transporter ATP-binding protein [Hyphomicrobiaceae bacterium]|nr:ABC transporter ATP-binding protein [Hyphomicrobiaceae bacterium]